MRCHSDWTRCSVCSLDRNAVLQQCSTMCTEDHPQERVPWVNWNRTKISPQSLTALIAFIRWSQNKCLCKSVVIGLRRPLFSPVAIAFCDHILFEQCLAHLKGKGLLPSMLQLLACILHANCYPLEELINFCFLNWDTKMSPKTKTESNSISFQSAFHSLWMQLCKTESELAEFPWDIGAEAPEEKLKWASNRQKKSWNEYL